MRNRCRHSGSGCRDSKYRGTGQARSGYSPSLFNGGLYRARDGKFMGVCQGVADYFHMPVFWIRALVIVATFATGFLPALGIYILLGLVLKPRPVVEVHSDSERAFYDDCLRSRSDAFRHLKERAQAVDSRLRRMEDVVTRKGYDWERRFRSGKP